jgi:hypothetical protein
LALAYGYASSTLAKILQFIVSPFAGFIFLEVFGLVKEIDIQLITTYF